MTNPPKVLLFKGTGWVSRLIRWQTNGVYSHMAVQYADGTIYEAWHSPPKFRRRPPLTNWSNVDAFTVRGMTEGGAARGREWLEAQLGKPYDFGGVARFITRWRKEQDDKWFCSEAGFRWSQVCGVPLLHRCDLAQASPTVCSFSPLLIPAEPYL